jgi:hypothetical protein
MTGRRAIVGLSLLTALVVCAFAAPNASALQGTTAYTCMPVKMAAAFSDEHCTKEAEGGEGWIHEEIAANVKTHLSVTNNETMAKTIPSKFKATVGGVKFEAEASGYLSCEGEKTRVQNSEAGEQMFTGGLFCGEFTNVVVKEPANCEVQNKTIKLSNENIWISHVVVNPETKKEEMWLEFIPEGGKLFATFEIVGKDCGIKNTKVKVEGTAETTGMFPTDKSDGATLKFTTKTTGETLKVGATPAEFEGTFTPRMLLQAEKNTNPITLTTTEN